MSAEIQKLYIAYFGRPADPGGLSYWVGQLASGVSLTQVANSFSSSPEYQAIYTGKSNLALIDQLYQNLFGRSSDFGGLQYWANEMASGRQTITSIASTLSSATTPGSADNIAINSKIAAASAFTAAIDTVPELIAYSGTAAVARASSWLSAVRDSATLATAIAPATLTAAVADSVAAGASSGGQTFTLTTGADRLSGSSMADIFSATVGADGTVANGSTLNPGDNLTGGLGEDRLNISVSGSNAAATTVASITLAGIESVMVSNFQTDDARDNTFNLTDATGVTTIGISSSAASGDTLFTNVRALAAAQMNQGAGDLSITYVDAAVAGLADVQTLALSGVTAGTFVVAATATGGVETLAVTSSGGTRNVLTGVTNNASLTSITVAGDTAVTLGTLGDAVTSLNASANSGGVTAIMGGTATTVVTGSSGNDSITTGSVDLNTGSVNAGTGTDTLVSTADARLTSSTLGAKYTGFETLSLSTSAATTTNRTQDTSFVAGLTAANVTVVDTTDDNADFTQTATLSNLSATLNTISVTGLSTGETGGNDDLIVTVAATRALNTAADSMTLNLGTSTAVSGASATAVAAGVQVILDVSLANEESITINSLGGTTGANFIRALTNGSATGVTLTGARDLSFGSMSSTVVTSINGSAMTGSLVMGTNAGAAASTISGGSGNDTLTGGSGADNISGNAGADSITGAAGADVITGGAGNDTIVGGSGIDNLSGGDGDDTFNVTTITDFTNLTSAEIVAGGEGNDTLAFSATATALTLAAADLTGISSINTITINGTSGAGSITLTDAVFTANGATTLRIEDGNRAADTAGTLTVDASALTAANSVTVLANTLTATNDTLTGGRGNDTFIFSTAAGLEGNDVVNGGAGTDTISLTASAAVTAVMTNTTNIERIVTTGNGTGNVTVTVLDANITSAVAASGSTAAVAMGSMTMDASSLTNGTAGLNYDGSNVTTVTGVGKIQNITGTAGVDTIIGGSGNDIISGGDAIDSITGGVGIDNLSGGEGNDTFFVTAANQFVGLDAAETVLGGNGDDTLNFSVGAANIAISAADLAGINSIRTFSITNADSRTASLTLTDAVYTANGAATLAVTNAGTGTADGISVTASGLSAANTLTYTASVAHAANESVLGGAGNDTFTFTTAAAGNTLLDANDTINGGAGNDLLTIATATKTLVATTLTNVTNIERITVSGTTGGTGLITLDDANFATITGAAISATSLTTGALQITAAAEDDSTFVITGGAGNDSIIGGQLADTISGGAGSDTITGGLLADSLSGGAGADNFVFATVAQSSSSNTDTISDFVSGSDKLDITLDYNTNTSGIEVNANVTTAAAGLTATQETLTGTRGQAVYDTTNSTLYVNVNNDNLLTSSDYKININAASTAASTVASADLNFTITTGSGADTIVAGSGNDTIVSGGGADTITGGAGADHITSGTGTDSILGGAGADIFAFSANTSIAINSGAVNTSTGTDRIDDFLTGTDKIQLTFTNGDTSFVLSTHVLVGAPANSSTAGAVGSYAATTYLAQFGNIGSAGDAFSVAVIVTSDGTAAGIANAALAQAATVVDITASGGGDTITLGVNNDTVRAAAGVDVITAGGGNDTIILSADANADKVVFSGGAVSVANQLIANGLDTITGFVSASDLLNVAALGDGSTGAGSTALTAAGVAQALVDDEAIVISANGAAANLTTGGTATVSDFTDLTAVAAYLSERFTSAANGEGVIVINYTGGANDTSFVYTYIESGAATTLTAAELALVGIVTHTAGTALVAANVVYA